MISRTTVLCRLLEVASLVLALAASSACRRQVAVPAENAGGPQVTARAVAVPVEGMICQVCAGSVKSALKEVRGVRDVEVSLEQRKATIHYEEGVVTLDQLTAAIADSGFKAGIPTPIRSR